MTEPMFIGQHACIYAMIAVCSLLGLIILGIVELVRQELEFRKLDRHRDKIMGRVE